MDHTNTALKATPCVLNSVSELSSFVQEQKSYQKQIALVPTMGALHEGHIRLVSEALKRAQCVIVSIFVNPTQFGDNEDLSNYPRTIEADLEKLTQVGVHAVFMPTAQQMYPEGFSTNISLKGISETLEGEYRPGHFDGVATVVSKLLLQSMADLALFGEKDWQQLQVIKQMVSDLNIPTEIIGIETVRDENGLALSSRNSYLTESEYKKACTLNTVLFSMADKLRNGSDVNDVQSWGHKALEEASFDKIDYLEIRDAKTLSKPQNKPLRILAAVKCGKARLIDNVGV